MTDITGTVGAGVLLDVVFVVIKCYRMVTESCDDEFVPCDETRQEFSCNTFFLNVLLPPAVTVFFLDTFGVSGRNQ